MTTTCTAGKPKFETDYGTRFICACGVTSSFYTSRRTAESMHGAHVKLVAATVRDAAKS